ncbi:hypothetical protein DRO59_06900 [Candidatus Bathyarchaeota archaeon]|nr:MAG: hypothetical protein DRO59_06900 [Candidatus Bathyarchaeota archaeon]
MKKQGSVVAIGKANPRVTVFLGTRGLGLVAVATHPKSFDSLKETLISVVKLEGPVDKIAAAHRVLGDVAFVQSNFAEYLVRETAKPRTTAAFKKLIQLMKKEEPVDITKGMKKPKSYMTYLNTRFNPVRSKNEAALILVDLVDPRTGFIVFEICVDKAGLTKKGIGLYEQVGSSSGA